MKETEGDKNEDAIMLRITLSSSNYATIGNSSPSRDSLLLLSTSPVCIVWA